VSIVIVGAYGFDNVGDEAMLYVVLRNLQKILPDDSRIVSCVDQRAVKKLHNVDTVCGVSPVSVVKSLIRFRFDDFRYQLKVISQMKLLVYGGGSLLNDSKGIKNISVILMTIVMARIKKVPIIIWGVGIGPIRSNLGQHVIKAILKLATVIVVRDKQSVVAANKLGVEQLKIRQGTDLLFNSLRWNDLERKNSAVVNKPLQIGISLRPFPGNNGVDYIEKDRILVAGVVESLHSLVSLRSVEVAALVFSKGPAGGRRDDLGILNRVKKELPSELFRSNIGGLSEEGDDSIELIINRMLKKISGLDIVIGERFHSLVTAALMGVPFIAISYDQKVRELVKISGMEDYCIDFQENISEFSLGEAIVYKVELLLKNYSQIQKMLSNNINKMEKIAEQDGLYIFDTLSNKEH